MSYLRTRRIVWSAPKSERSESTVPASAARRTVSAISIPVAEAGPTDARWFESTAGGGGVPTSWAGATSSVGAATAAGAGGLGLGLGGEDALGTGEGLGDGDGEAGAAGVGCGVACTAVWMAIVSEAQAPALSLVAQTWCAPAGVAAGAGAETDASQEVRPVPAGSALAQARPSQVNATVPPQMPSRPSNESLAGTGGGGWPWTICTFAGTVSTGPFASATVDVTAVGTRPSAATRITRFTMRNEQRQV